LAISSHAVGGLFSCCHFIGADIQTANLPTGKGTCVPSSRCRTVTVFRSFDFPKCRRLPAGGTGDPQHFRSAMTQASLLAA
jgi:hypothetical protein